MPLHNSVNFSTFTELCSHDHNPVLEQFTFPLKVPFNQPSFPPPSPATLTCCLNRLAFSENLPLSIGNAF